MKSKAMQDSKHLRAILIAIAIFLVIGIAAVLVYRPETADFIPLPGRKQAEEAKVATVTITKKGFNPEAIMIEKGTTVEWINIDTKPHWPASNPHPTHDALPGFDAEEALEKGDKYQFTFNQTSTFDYHDHLNPTVGGSVIVR